MTLRHHKGSKLTEPDFQNKKISTVEFCLILFFLPSLLLKMNFCFRLRRNKLVGTQHHPRQPSSTAAIMRMQVIMLMGMLMIAALISQASAWLGGLWMLPSIPELEEQGDEGVDKVMKDLITAIKEDGW